jgi:hypothetical protein
VEVGVTGVVVQRPVRGTVTVVVTAVVLGVLAFMADAVDGVAGQIVVAVVSSGLV